MEQEHRIVHDIIPQKLAEIEQKENVRILHCVESGSRAWGFASPDSDFDVRFVYVRPREFYLRLDKTRDVIEWQLDDTLDINGWDLQKALTLLHKSNPTVFEWDRSPIVYKTTEQWCSMAQTIQRYFSPKLGLYHYLNIAKNSFHSLAADGPVKLKRYFYVLRSILACRWIVERNSPPPVPFAQLSAAYMPPEIAPTVEALLQVKTTVSELGTGERIGVLDDYITRAIAEVESILANWPIEPPPSWDELNQVFLHTLQ